MLFFGHLSSAKDEGEIPTCGRLSSVKDESRILPFCSYPSSLLSGRKKFPSSEPYSSEAVSRSENGNPFFAIGEEEKDPFSKLSNSAEDKRVETSLGHSSLEGESKVFSGCFGGEGVVYGFKCAPVTQFFKIYLIAHMFHEGGLLLLCMVLGSVLSVTSFAFFPF